MTHLAFTAHSNIGGSSTAAAYLANALVERDFEVSWVASARHRYLSERVRHEPVFVGDALKLNLGATLQTADALVNLGKHKPIDVVCAHFAVPFAVSAQIYRHITGVPFVVSFHGSDVHNEDIYRHYGAVTTAAAENAAATTTISRYLAEEIRRKSDGALDPEVIPNFIPASSFHPDEIDDEPRDRLLHVSNFTANKNVELLARAFALLAEERPGLRLTLAGDGETKERVRELVRALGVGDRVEFIGVVEESDELRRLVGAHDATIMASDMEGLPLSLLETLQCGRPILSTNVGGVPEIVGESYPFLFPPRDLDACAEALRRLYADPLGFAERRREALKISRRYSEEEVVGRYERVYRRAAERGTRPTAEKMETTDTLRRNENA
ncbi:MAG: glycosyltransferase [Ignavibacteriales bacterium]|nr:glycosyltransferase [Ignavibacteriales bacterium]